MAKFDYFLVSYGLPEVVVYTPLSVVSADFLVVLVRETNYLFVVRLSPGWLKASLLSFKRCRVDVARFVTKQRVTDSVTLG